MKLKKKKKKQKRNSLKDKYEKKLREYFEEEVCNMLFKRNIYDIIGSLASDYHLVQSTDHKGLEEPERE
jgi:hypothetical protein